MKRSHWQLVQRRYCLVPTGLGWLVLLLVAMALTLFVARNIYSFLAITDPANAEVLVVEAWIPDYALEKVIVEFNRKRYSKLYLTGGPIELGFHLSEYKNYPMLATATLTKLGLNKEFIEEVPAPDVPKDRTYASAWALKKWFRDHQVSLGALQVMSLGPHARRTRLLFEKAFGDDFIIGITAIQEPHYDADNWWKTSAGVRSVIGETIAYVYARVFVLSASMPDIVGRVQQASHTPCWQVLLNWGLPAIPRAAKEVAPQLSNSDSGLFMSHLGGSTR